MFGDAGHRSPYLSHAKQALYRLSYVPVLFKLRGSLWTKLMIDQVSICNELSILSFCQSEQNRIVEVSKIIGDAGLQSLYPSHAKRELYQLSYIPVLFKLRASFWTKSMIYQLSICNELSIPSHYQQTPNRILEAWKSFGDWHLSMRGSRSYVPVPSSSHASEASSSTNFVSQLRGIDPRTPCEASALPFKLRASFEQNPWYISFRFVTSCQFFPSRTK